MPVKIIGEHPLAKEDGKLKNVMANVFPTENAVITGPGTHGGLIADYLNNEKSELTTKELDLLEDKLCDTMVPLHMRGDVVLIRPTHGMMDLAFEADEILQEIIPKEKIKFLGVLDEGVRDAIKKRGELWRINYLPKTTEEMKKMMDSARGSISDRVMYYHNMETGTRYLTYEEFTKLGELPAEELAKYLNEIKDNCCTANACGHQEIRLFMADDSFDLDEFQDEDFTTWDESRLREHYEIFRSLFEDAVEAEFRKDDPENEEWRKAMFSRLIGKPTDEISEEVLLGLCPEFYMHIQWLPGARIEHGEVIFDPVFEKEMPDEEKIYDEKVRDVLFNFKRRYNDIEYINLGRVTGSLSKREKMPGRREVYIAEIKVKGEKKERVKIIRMQRWGVVELIESGEVEDVHEAVSKTQEYKRYILDRWIGCEQLGINLLPVTTGEIIETIKDIEVPLIYYERDYIDGRASDKISASKYKKRGYSARFAKLLGRAAAPNIILGRVNNDGLVLFDDGDEVVVETKNGMPSNIIVGDITSSFGNYEDSLEKFTQAYAQPVIKRAGLVPDIKKFADIYVEAFIGRFKEIQKEYRTHKGAFNSLFADRKNDANGSFAYRWEKILERLDSADAEILGKHIRSYIKRETGK